MANFFEGLWGLAKHPFDEAEFMVKGARDVVKGDRSVGDLFGDHQDMMSENITVPLGGRNKLTENSDAVAGAIVGGILAAPMMAGAGGGASGAGAGGSGGGSLFSLGDVGGYFKPSTAFGGGGSGSGFQGMGSTPSFDISQGAGWQPNSTGIGELMENGGAYKASTEFGGADAAKGTDWQAVARMLQSIKPNQEQNRISTSGGRAGGGFRFDRNQYENKLLTREYESLYNQPLYNKLG